MKEGSLETFHSIVVKSREKIVFAYAEIGIQPDEQGIWDISVSYDGCLQKQG